MGFPLDVVSASGNLMRCGSLRRESMAAAANVAIADVAVVKTSASTVPGSGVNVHVSVEAADEESAKALAQSLTNDNINEELTNRGLPEGSFLMVETCLSPEAFTCPGNSRNVAVSLLTTVIFVTGTHDRGQCFE